MGKKNITALFAGIGGLELGLHRHGHRTTLFCESDPEASAVLAHRFTRTPINFDVRDTKRLASEIDPRSDLLTAGFPCTDLSQAGLTRGFSGAQSGLVRKVIRLLDARPFANVLIENVPNWRVLHGGRYMSEVIRALETRGFRWAYRVIDARAFGIPHRRRRVFLFATQEGDPCDVLFHGNAAPDDSAYSLTDAAHGFYWTEGNTGLGWGENCIPPLKGGSAIGIPAAPAILLPEGEIITPDLRDGERIQGFNVGWTDLETILPTFGGRKFNQRKRWLLLGNAVHVAVSDWIGKNLANQPKWTALEGEPLKRGSGWPNAAWYDGKRRWAVTLGAWPVKLKQKSLAQFLRYEGRLLSLRATTGFYRRIKASPLRITQEFKAAVARHITRMEQLEIMRIAAE